MSVAILRQGDYLIASIQSDLTDAQVIDLRDDLSNRMGQLTTSLLSKYGKEWTYSIAVNDLYYDFSAPSLVQFWRV